MAPSSKDHVEIVCEGSARFWAHVLRTIGWTASGPMAVFTSMLRNSVSTASMVTCKRKRLMRPVCIWCGCYWVGTLEVYTSQNAEAKYSFILSGSELSSLPGSLRGPTLGRADFFQSQEFRKWHSIKICCFRGRIRMTFIWTLKQF